MVLAGSPGEPLKTHGKGDAVKLATRGAGSRGRDVNAGAEVSGYAKRLPKPKATGVPTVDARLASDWVAAQKVITAMQEDISLGSTLHGQLELMKMSGTGDMSSNEWSTTTVNCSRLPKYFMEQSLVANDPTDTEKSIKFTQDILDLVDSVDPRPRARFGTYMQWVAVGCMCRRSAGRTSC